MALSRTIITLKLHSQISRKPDCFAVREDSKFPPPVSYLTDNQLVTYSNQPLADFPQGCRSNRRRPISTEIS